jgi:hypothetical protein
VSQEGKALRLAAHQLLKPPLARAVPDIHAHCDAHGPSRSIEALSDHFVVRWISRADTDWSSTEKARIDECDDGVSTSTALPTIETLLMNVRFDSVMGILFVLRPVTRSHVAVKTLQSLGLTSHRFPNRQVDRSSKR